MLFLRTKLELKSLMETAIKINQPKKHKDIKYEKLIRIDYLGIGATALFDRSKNYREFNAWPEVQKILKNVKTLNKEGYFVKFRVLLQYPYSATAFARRIAEVSYNRASINDPQYLRNFEMIDEIDKGTLEKSFFLVSQTNMLTQIMDINDTLLTNDNYWNNGLNKFTIRFTPFDPLMSCLLLNNNLFYDVYMLSKKERLSSRLEHLSPIVHLEKNSSAECFSSFEDHFRYLWGLDVTMDRDDVIHRNGLTVTINQPNEIKYKHKARRIRAKSPNLSDAQEEVWKYRVYCSFTNFCGEFFTAPPRERLFISCNWYDTEEGAIDYDENVQKLKKILDHDFNDGDIRVLDIFIVRAPAGKGLAKELYEALKKSSIGIVFLTEKIRCNNEQIYASPNVYHELGYLMHHLGEGRIIILREKGVEITANMQDVSRIDFKKECLFNMYPEIVKAICDVCFSKKKLLSILNKYSKRLEASFQNNEIDPKAYKKIINKINDMRNPQ